MVTGCYAGKHGVYSNYSFALENKGDSWQWFHSAVKVEDIFSAAKLPDIAQGQCSGRSRAATRMWIIC